MTATHYDLNYIKGMYTPSEIREIADTIHAGDITTEEQGQLLQVCKYTGTMSIEEVKKFLSHVACEIERLEREAMNELNMTVEEVIVVINDHVCPYCQSKLEAMMAEMSVQCISCKEKFSWMAVQKTRWFPKRLVMSI